MYVLIIDRDVYGPYANTNDAFADLSYFASRRGSVFSNPISSGGYEIRQMKLTQEAETKRRLEQDLEYDRYIRERDAQLIEGGPVKGEES
jgi:hypothetical protein